MAAINGQGNNYPEGQCTVYADERYHTLTGYYVPWSGNAADWSSMAIAYGWTVSSKPIVPSIICLQPGTQGADGTYGHVAVVENIDGNTVVTSTLNWGPNYSAVSTVNFHVGPGVSFIYAKGGNGRAVGQASNSLTTLVSNLVSGGEGSTLSVAPSADVTNLLFSLDTLLSLTNPFDVPLANETISLPGVSIPFTDPISWVEGFGMNIVEDFVALCVRLILIIIGVAILYKVSSNFIDYGEIAKGAAMLGGI